MMKVEQCLNNGRRKGGLCCQNIGRFAQINGIKKSRVLFKCDRLGRIRARQWAFETGLANHGDGEMLRFLISLGRSRIARTR